MQAKRPARAPHLMVALLAIGVLLAGGSAARGGQDPAAAADLASRLDCAVLGDAQYQRMIFEYEQKERLEQRAAASPLEALTGLEQLHPGLDVSALRLVSVEGDEAVYEGVVDEAVALVAQVQRLQADAYVLAETALCPSFLNEVSS